MTKKPLFRPRGNHEVWKKAMVRWLGDKLDDQHVKAVNAASANSLSEEEWCIALARAGNPEPLRQLYPQFKDCIHSPKRRKGRPRKPGKYNPVKTAADFAKRIRVIWREEYRKVNRTSAEHRAEHSAEHFAVKIMEEWRGKEILGLTVEAVEAAVNGSGS